MLAAAWVGLLPIVVIGSVFLVKFLFPVNPRVGPGQEVIAVILIPIFASLARAAAGRNQLLRICGGIAPLGRQFALSAAIVLLFVFEMFSCVMTFADDEPQAIWLIPLAFYALYLVCIFRALRPMPARVDARFEA